MTLRKIFFARAIDYRSPVEIAEERVIIEARLQMSGLMLIDPLTSEPPSKDPSVLVRHDLSLLAQCAAMLALMTIPHRNYIGVCCELVYANMLRIPTFVCIGETDYGMRPFLVHHSTFIARTLDHCISKLTEHFATSK
jgi:hypothetical protein